MFQPDPQLRSTIVRELLAAGMDAGGRISAEHGVGSREEVLLPGAGGPHQIELMKRIKRAFDPKGILNPGTLFD